MPILLPEILSEHREDADIGLDLRVPPELAHFAGHFPGFAILPGVVQVDWAVRLARPRLSLRGGFSALEDLKFSSLILPDAEVRLRLALDATGRVLSFAYTGGGRKHSAGRIVFGHAP